MITTVLIDIDNTLLDFNACAKKAMIDGFFQWNLPFAEEFFEKFKVINDELWRKIEMGIISRKELHQIRWQTVFDAIGVKADGPQFEQLFLKLIFDSCEQVEGALDLVKYLSEKYDLYVASNGLYKQQINRLTRAGLIDYVKKIFSSEVIGHQKPAYEFFEACFNDLPGVKKEEIIMIGDSLTADIKGGNSFGIKTLWYNYHKENAKGINEADYVVDSLAEIKEIL